MASYRKELKELRERQRAKEEKNREISEISRKKVNEAHALVASKANVQAGRARFINNKGYSDAVAELEEVTNRLEAHNQRYKSELAQKAGQAKHLADQALQKHTRH